MRWGRRNGARGRGSWSLAGACASIALLARGVFGGDVAEPPAYRDFLVIPIRAHILSATDMPEVECGLTDADVRRVVGKVNGIWHRAGIHWALDAIVREPAARQDEFRRRRSARGERGVDALDLFRLLVPEASKSEEGLHVYYIHRFSVNGVYLGHATAFVQETAALRPVEGGIDEPLPRVTAHELGHALGLPHRQARTNLLASGTTGTILNQEEVDRAREVARQTKGARSVIELRHDAEAAEAAGDRDGARRIWATLAAVPGDGAAEALRRRDSLETTK